MTSKELRSKLLALIEACENSAMFLDGVTGALETLYADSEAGCPAGFQALDEARVAFEASDAAEA